MAKNASVLFLSQIISFILSFFYIMYTARYLGSEGFGILSFALAFAGVFGVFNDLGLQQITVREVARDKSLADKYIGNIVVIKLIIISITFGFFILTTYLLGYSGETINVVFLIWLSVTFGTFSNIFYAIFQAFEKMEYLSAGQILNSVLLLCGTLFAISHDFNVVGFAFIYFLSNTIVLIFNIVISLLKFIRPKLEFNFSFWKATIIQALPFGLSGIFFTIYYWIDSVMLFLMKGDVVVGWYNAAYRLFGILIFIPGVINTVVFPIMSRYYISSRHSLNLIYKKYFKFMLAISFPICVGTTLLAERIILVIFGAEYTQSIIALQILIWAMMFIFANAAFVKLFESTNKQILVTKITGIGAILNIILNLIIIPRFSYVGASITTTITEFIVVILVLIFAYKHGYGIKRKEFLTNAFKITIAGLIMGVFIWELKTLNLFLLMSSSALLYLGILYIIRVIDKEDIQLLKNVRKTKW